MGIFKLTKLMEITILRNPQIAEKVRHMFQTNVLQLSNWKAMQCQRDTKYREDNYSKNCIGYLHRILPET